MKACFFTHFRHFAKKKMFYTKQSMHLCIFNILVPRKKITVAVLCTLKNTVGDFKNEQMKLAGPYKLILHDSACCYAFTEKKVPSNAFVKGQSTNLSCFSFWSFLL